MIGYIIFQKFDKVKFTVFYSKELQEQTFLCSTAEDKEMLFDMFISNISEVYKSRASRKSVAFSKIHKKINCVGIRFAP